MKEENPVKEKATDKVALNLVAVQHHRRMDLPKLSEPEAWPFLFSFFFYPRPLGRSNFFSLRLVILVAMIFFSVQLWLGRYDAWIFLFLHNLNLPVHEAGHVIFGFFSGRLIMTLGGSLFQVMMPLIFCFVLWISQRDLLGAAVGLWWALENLIDVAQYIGDALPMKLMLINGVTGAESEYGFHDWNYILAETGHLVYYGEIEHAVIVIANVGLFLCVLWAAWSLFYYWFYQRN